MWEIFGTEHLMNERHSGGMHDGTAKETYPPHKQDLISKTIQRPSIACRLVITLEVEFDWQVLKDQPAHMRAAVDYMRKHLEQFGTGFDFAEMLEYIEGAKLLMDRVEVAP